MSKRVLFIEHDYVSLGGPIWRQFTARGYEIVRFNIVDQEHATTPNVTVEWPNLLEYDVIVPMGSPWGAWDDATIGNWLLPEIKHLKAAHDAGVPILGICFGGQLMARVLGGSVAPAPQAEIGWHVIVSDDESLISRGPWMQFHYDRFVVPPGAVEIARSPLAPQAFTMGRTLGLQFHPEMDPEVLEAWFAKSNGEKAEAAAAGLDVAILRAQTKYESEFSNRRAAALVDGFLDTIATRSI